MQPFTPLTSTIVCLPQRNIDTDQIIPARHLKGTSRDGYGDQLFADWRYLSGWQPVSWLSLNQQLPARQKFYWPAITSAAVHHVSTLPGLWLGFGFRAIISTSFADIFHNNALKNGLLPCALECSRPPAFTRDRPGAA